MQLPEQDANRFFELTFPLHLFVNEQLGVLPEVKSLEDYSAYPHEAKLQVRDALYDNIDLIDAFIQNNPFDFSPDDLAIVAKWKHFVRGDFYIERS